MQAIGIGTDAKNFTRHIIVRKRKEYRQCLPDFRRRLKNADRLSTPNTSLHFIRSATLLIEELYPSTNAVIEIEARSCRLAGQLMCTYLMKMLFAFYNIEPMSEEESQISMEYQSRRIISPSELDLLRFSFIHI